MYHILGQLDLKYEIYILKSRNVPGGGSPDSIHESKRIKLDILGSSEFLTHRSMCR